MTFTHEDYLNEDWFAGDDLDSFLEYLFQGMYGEQDLKEAFEDGKKEAQDSEISICSECEEEIYG